MTRDVKRCCLTCKYAEVATTPKGKPRREKAINCKFPPPDAMVIRGALVNIVPASMLQHFTGVDSYAYGMWADREQCDGHDCGVWEAKQ